MTLCKQGKNAECLDKLYAKDAVSVEALSPPSGEDRVASGLDAIKAKGKTWAENNTVHKAEVAGPYPNEDRFAVRFTYDITNKPSGQRMTMDEVGAVHGQERQDHARGVLLYRRMRRMRYRRERMTLKRLDNVGLVVDDMPAAIAFFTALGLKLEGETTVEGPWVDSTIGLDNVRSDIAMMRTPDGHSRLELAKFHGRRRSAPGRKTRRRIRWASFASCSPSTTSTTPSPACAPAAAS